MCIRDRSDNCRTWIYFDGVILDPPALKRRFNLPDCVEPHEYVDIKAGNEQGLICNVHHDGLMGPHPSARTLKIVG